MFHNVFVRSENIIIHEQPLFAFYSSVRKMAICSFLGKAAWPEILKLSEKCQLPILQALADKNLDIYDGLDKKLRNALIANIRQELDLRSRTKKHSKESTWKELRKIIEWRSEIYSKIFQFTDKDMEYFENISLRYKRRLFREDKKKLVLKTGIGAAVIGFGGLIIYRIFSSKKENK